MKNVKKMIDNINNISSNKKLMDTFFNLNGRAPSETELDSITDSTNINMEIDNSSINSNSSQETNNSDDSIATNGSNGTNGSDTRNNVEL